MRASMNAIRAARAGTRWNAGLVKTTVSVFGHPVSLYRAEGAGLDPTGGPWATVCEEHRTVCNHATRRLAEQHLRRAEWCEACRGTDPDPVYFHEMTPLHP